MLLSLLLSTLAGRFIRCEYQMYSTPFAAIEMVYDEAGNLDPFVVVDQQGQRHRESFSVADPGSGELLHGWIAKESSENSLELILYREDHPEGRSLLINPHLPFGNRLWGRCRFSPSAP